MADPLVNVERAAHALERAKVKEESAREALRAAILTAHGQGASLSAIARAAHVSRQYVAQLVAKGRDSQA